MKIFVINNLYHPFGRGGAEKVAEKIVLGLERSGHEVFVLSTKPIRSDEADTEKRFFISSRFFDLDKYSMIWRLFFHIFDCFDFIKASQVKRTLLKEKPDLVITNNLKGLGFLLPRVIKGLKIKHFHILHDIQLLHPSGLMMWGREGAIDSFCAKAYQVINRFLFSSPAVVISPSKWLLGLHRDRGFFERSKGEVLPNFFPASSGDVASRPMTNKVDGIANFLYIGQIESHKGVEFLIDAFTRFFVKHPNSRLSIVGSGSRLEDLRKSTDCYGIAFLGKKDSPEVLKMMFSSDYLIVPSLCYENSPTVIYEAAFVGLPVIASNIGGIGELVERFGGILFDPGDAEDLLSKMEGVVSGYGVVNSKDKVAGFSEYDYIKVLLGLAER